MPLTIKTGNIFTTELQTIVNTVNCVGVMGAGIALECRLRYPSMFPKYVSLCEHGGIDIGKLWLYKGTCPSEKWVLNFPTKRHWRYPSKLEYLQAGLEKFVETFEEKNIESIAFPTLGSLNGGLSPIESLTLMEEYLSDLPIQVEIFEYDSCAPDDLYDDVKSFIINQDVEIIQNQCKIGLKMAEKILAAFKREDIHQLNQLGKIKGIGVTTLSKVYTFAKQRPPEYQQSLIFPN
jgi:O-acetyl-ADP-ribose deacetylase (regulator of RNase III)